MGIETLYENLAQELAEKAPHWKKTERGYKLGDAELFKVKKRWVLRYQGKDHNLPKRRASLDHAEKILATLK